MTQPALVGPLLFTNSKVKLEFRPAEFLKLHVPLQLNCRVILGILQLPTTGGFAGGCAVSMLPTVNPTIQLRTL